MKRIATLIAIMVGCWMSSGIPSPVLAEEPAQAFLEALRNDDHPYYDIAIDYLASLETSDLISAEFKSGLPFERAQTLIGSASKMRDMGMVEKRLDEAQKLLTDFAAKNQSLEVTAKTFHYQGNLLYRRSNIYLKQSKSDRLTAGEKEELFLKARSHLESSLASYQKAKGQILRLIDPNSEEAIKIDPEDPSTIRRRNQFRTRFTQVRVSLPMVTEQLADTYDEGDANRKKYLTTASEEYKKVWYAYPKFLSGLKAAVYSARCHQKLGQHKKALELLTEIFALGNSGALKAIKLQAYVLATECWQKTTPYPHNEIVRLLEPAVKVLNRVEIRNPDWIRVQLELAVATRAKAGEVKKKRGPKANSESKEMERAAARILRSVSRVPSPHRDRARELMSKWDIPLTEVAETGEKPPATFDEARQKGQDYVAEIQVSLAESSQLRKQVASEKDAAKKAELQKQLDEVTGRIDQQSQSALALLSLALDLSNDETVRADINNVRYLQAYCYFAGQRYFESALIGEFLLSKYPTIDGTRQAMSLMIQSYSIMLDQAKDDDKAFERTRLTNACSAVVKRWPGSRESGSAASTMTRLALNEKNFPEARKYFEQIPSSASYRNAIGVQLGQRMWFDYKGKLKALSGGDPAQLKALDQQLHDAKQYMLDGVESVSIDSLNYETALGALLLIDAHLRSGEVDEAVRRLEGAAIAPLDLVKQKHPAITDTSMAALYRRETYKTAIKTYLAAMESGSDQQKWIDKASGIIKAMRDEMQASSNPADRSRITAIYQLIAKELKENFEALQKPEEKKKFASSLASFLNSIEKDSIDAKTVLWAGSTLLGVAESLSQSGLVNESKPLFQQAVSALSRAETIGFKGDPQQEAMVLELKRQRALAQRGSGKYEAAVDQFAEVLTASPNALNIQIDAAETLQMWAKAVKRPQGYVEAIKGAKPVKNPNKRSTKLIWGWEKIAKATRGNQNFRSTYYRALYHVAECRLEYGVLENNPKAITSAGIEIRNEGRRDPTFNGSAEWKAKFKALAERVNAAKKE